MSVYGDSGQQRETVLDRGYLFAEIRRSDLYLPVLAHIYYDLHPIAVFAIKN